MRKAFSILLLVLFIATNSDGVITVHFCHGSFSGCQFNLKQIGIEKCHCKNTKGCCHTKTQVIKLKSSFLKKSSQQNVELSCHGTIFLAYFIPEFYQSNKVGIYHNIGYFPPGFKDRNIQYQVFRF